MLTTDIKRAYDTVSHTDLLRSLERINLPRQFIKLVDFILKKRTCKLITPYGLTDGFKPTKGIEQGDSLAPLLWNIFFDHIISSINSISRNDAFILNSLTFADDVTLLGRTDDDIKLLFKIFNEKCNECGLEISLEKCCFFENSKRSDTLTHIDLSLEDAIALPIPYGGDKTFRFLGCQIALKGKQDDVFQKILEEVRQGANILKGKRISGKIMAYLVTAVFHPKIIHMSFCTPLTSSELRKIENHWIALTKRAHILPKYVPNAILYHCSYLKKLQEHVEYRQITQFLSLLQKSHAASNVIKLIFEDALDRSNNTLFNGVKNLKSQRRYLWLYLSNRMLQYGITIEKIPDFIVPKRPQLHEENSGTINLWTDGSLVMTDNSAKMSGAFIACTEAGEKIFEYSCQVDGIPSSTWAELQAIFMGLRYVDASKKVNIFTDSQAAIFSLEKLIDPSFACDDTFFTQSKNGLILRNIVNEIFCKKLQINLHKVKAHSGVPLNEESDHLASLGHNSLDKLSLSLLKEHRFKIRYKKKYLY